jgi:hypothetical protein
MHYKTIRSYLARKFFSFKSVIPSRLMPCPQVLDPTDELFKYSRQDERVLEDQEPWKTECANPCNQSFRADDRQARTTFRPSRSPLSP